MLKFEWKKVFSRPKSRIAILIMIAVLIVTSVLTINRVEYVDENGNHSTGISAARELRAAKNEWAGPLTGDVLQEVIAENDKINHSEEAQSNDIEKQDKAYAEKQGISGILSVISSAFSAYPVPGERLRTLSAAVISNRRIFCWSNIPPRWIPRP